jgi:hypothetical protein
MIYQFKITLNKTNPVVWRRIQVPDTFTFRRLHCINFIILNIEYVAFNVFKNINI